MRLFSDTDRTSNGRKLHAEPSYGYLDRSGREEAQAIRDTYEAWFKRYPAQYQADLLGRFTSPIDAQHVSAAFELYLFALFCCLGYEVSVHPETPSSKTTRPDFLLSSREGERLYVEAVQSIELSDEERAARTRLDVVFDTLDKLEVTEWFLGVDADAYPDTPPSGRRLRGCLKGWLESLDPDEVIRRTETGSHEAFPTFLWKDGDWRISFMAFPRPPDKRDRPVERALGAYFSSPRWQNTWKTIRDTLESKGSRYGELDSPLLIAVNASVFDLDDIDIMEALFGQEQFILDRRNPEAEPVIQRAANGFWHGPQGAQNQQVAGVLIGFDVHPWTTAVRQLTLFHNPWAEEPIRGLITRLSQKVPREGTMEAVTGEHPRELLGLPNSYPGMHETSA